MAAALAAGFWYKAYREGLAYARKVGSFSLPVLELEGNNLVEKLELEKEGLL